MAKDTVDLRSEPYNMKFKYNTEDEMPFMTVDFAKRGRGRPQALHTIGQGILYPGGRPTTEKKKSDMEDILYISPVYHSLSVP